MKNLISAIQFITILPAGRTNEYRPAGMLPFYPVVGLILGSILALFDYSALLFWPPDAVAFLDVVLMIILTGAFHIDGLADAADGLFSHRSKERQLQIMKDSRVGVMGLVAVIVGLGIKWAGIASLPPSGYERYIILLVIPSFSRGAMLFGIRFMEYGRAEGTARDHFNTRHGPGLFIWLTLPAALSMTIGLRGGWVIICFLLVVFFIIRLYKRKIGNITGDMIGAMAESTESVLFLMAAVNFL